MQPPGRENRITEPPDLSTDELAEALRRRTDRPYALYGHSMGGVVAHAVVQALVRSVRRCRPGSTSAPHRRR